MHTDKNTAVRAARRQALERQQPFHVLEHIKSQTDEGCECTYSIMGEQTRALSVAAGLMTVEEFEAECVLTIVPNEHGHTRDIGERRAA